MKHLLLFILIFLFISETLPAQSPQWLWANASGESGSDVLYSIAVDDSGNVYAVGTFADTTDFDPGPGTFYLTPKRYHDNFIFKKNALGNLVWAKSWGGKGDDYSSSLAMDHTGNLYITGNLRDTIDFDPGPGVYNLNQVNDVDVFVLKLSHEGDFIWAGAISGTGPENSYGISVDGQGNVYTTGNFPGTTDFDPGAGIYNLTSAGGNDIFVSKLDASGNFAWAKSFEGTGNDCGFATTVDSYTGDVYTTGYFSGTADFDPGAGIFNLTSAGTVDVFISSLDSSGNFVWAKRLGGTDAAVGYSIAVDPSGSGAVYTTGHFNSTTDFDPDPVNVWNLTPVGTSDVYISKLNSAGDFVYADSFGGSGGDYGFSTRLDHTGHVYITGFFSDTVDFDPDTLAHADLVSAGAYDGFIFKSDSSGIFEWAKALGGATNDVSNTIALGMDGYPYVGGYFGSPVVAFDSLISVMNYDTSGLTADFFIAKLDTSWTTGTQEPGNANPELILFPNPVTGLMTVYSGRILEKARLMITDITGKIIYTSEYFSQAIEIDTKDFEAGIYLLEVLTPELTMWKKFVASK